MAPRIEKISAVTFRVVNMMESVRFYRDVLGMELLYGGEDAGFSSLRAKDTQSAILNLEQGDKHARRSHRFLTSLLPKPIAEWMEDVPFT
jgi:catechol 2,3-dioxygenase-like lactoylglutathione lyase family enzyme